MDTATLLVPSSPLTAANGAVVPVQVSRATLASLAMAALLPSLGASIANVALPSLAASFDTTLADVQWVVLAYLGTMTAAMLVAGRAGDRFGRRRLLLVGLGVFAIASALGALAPWLWLLVVARAVQGVGAAVVMALALALVGDVVPRGQTGRAMGLLGAMSAVGTALGPSLGGALVAAFGWRGVFVVMACGGVLAVAVARTRLPRIAIAHALAVREGQALRASVPASRNLRQHLLALLGPFRDPASRAGLGANLIVSAVLMATLVVGPFYLSKGLGLEAAAVGAVMSLGPIAAALVGFPAGRLVDRLGPQRMVMIGLAGITLGCTLLALLPPSLGVVGYVAPVVVLTASYAIFQAANNTAVLREVAPDRRGVVAGALQLSRNLGLIVGTSLMGAIFVAAGMHVTFAVGAVAILVVLVQASWPTMRRALRSPATVAPRATPASKVGRRFGWKVPVLLTALSLVPLLFGLSRLAQLARGAALGPDEARFAEPLAVVLHIVAALLFSLLGAWQFSAELLPRRAAAPVPTRRRAPHWHKVSGRVVVVAGLVVALTGMWMAAFYPFPTALQGPLLLTVRLLVGTAMAVSLVLAVTTIRRGNVAAHRAWMMRAYALGLGAGTQVFVTLPWILAFGMPTHLPYELLMTSAWVINLAIAERIIRRDRKSSQRRALAPDPVVG